MRVLILLFCSSLSFAYQPPIGFDLKTGQASHCAVKLYEAERTDTPQPRLRPPTDTSDTPEYGKQSQQTTAQMVALTSSQLAVLNGPAFVEAIATSTVDDMFPLWTYDGSTPTAMAPARVSLVIDAIVAEQYGDPGRLDRLMYFVQIAFFHAFYEPAVSYDSVLKSAAINAVIGVSNRGDFLTENNNAVNLLRYRWSVAIDSVDGAHLALAKIEAVLAWYHNSPTAANDWYMRSTAFNMFFTLSRQVRANAPSASSSVWYNLIPASLMNLIREYAINRNYNEDTLMNVENAIYTLGNFSALSPSIAASARAAISDAYRIQDRLGGAWLRTVVDLDNFFEATLDDGTVLDLDAIKAELTTTILPNEYVYDNGRLTFQTSLSQETVELLLDAMHEVRSQFFRKSTFLDAVAGDPNEALTLVIYGSPADYQNYQFFLNGMSTNNGGIYIETTGTLFTYDRTPEQSTLTLEELLRHEYVHYLDARYLIVPSFGESPIYDQNRMTWYNEGLAEWLTGSTRANGVLTRENYVTTIGSDTTRLTIPEIVGISYSTGFKFYRYAGLLFTYLDQQRPDLLLQLFDVVRGNNANVLDAFYNQLKTDTNLQAGYNAFINARLAEIQNGTGLFAEDVSTVFSPNNLPFNNQATVQSTLTNVLPITAMTTTADRYHATGQVTLAINGSSEANIQDQLEAQLDQSLISLQSQGDNFVSAVAWAGNITMAGNLAQADLVVEGPFNGTGVTIPQNVPATPTGMVPAVVNHSVVLDWDVNSEPNLSGYRVYRSSFSGGPYTQIADTTNANYIDGGLAGGSYYYVISAYNAYGESSFTAEIGVFIQASSRLALHRYWDSVNTDHFYTTDFSHLGNGNGSVLYEGVECYLEASSVAGSLAFNRYWNAGLGNHFYTIDWSVFGSGNQFWLHEGIEGYAYPWQANDTVPLYRYWNAGIGDHFYTVDWSSLGAGDAAWTYEGIACYVYTNP